MSKGWKKIISLVLIAGMLCSGGKQTVQAKAQIDTESHGMVINALAKSMTELQLSWKAKKVTKYKVYRAMEKADGTIGKYRLVATIDGRKTKFSDKGLKKKKMYWYRMEGYKKNQLRYYGDATKYTGLWCNFDEYQVPDRYRGTDKIELSLCADYGVCPDGYKIYRREEGTKKFQLIKKLKKRTTGIKYMDKAVTAGRIYEYKVKTYRKFGKKVYYSKYTDVITMSATNQNGKFTVQFDASQSSAAEEAVFKLTSQSGNGELRLAKWADLRLCRKDSTDGNALDGAVQITEYSIDGKNWQEYQEESEYAVILRQGESVWIKIQSTQNEKINSLDELADFQLEMTVRYNHLSCILEMDLIGGTASAAVWEEAYH